MEYASPSGTSSEARGQKRVAELIRVPAEGVVEGIITSSEIWELPTHWSMGRTRPCTARAGECTLCESLSVRWYYLIEIYLRLKQRRVWVQLTEDAKLSLQLQLKEGRTLHGRDVRIGRERKTLRAPVWIVLESGTTSPDRLPKPRSPQETLERVFSEKAAHRQRKAS